MKTAKYMRMKTSLLTDDIKEKYDIDKKETEGYAYVKIKKGMYGLKAAAILAYDQLSIF